MWPTLLIMIYCALLIIASLAGGCLPALMRLTHTRMQLMMSLVGGLMMGVALLHLLPHAVVETDSVDYAAWSCTLGLLAMFLTIRVFQVHQHGPPDAETLQVEHHDKSHAHRDCEHPAHQATAEPRHLSWMGLFMGLAIHSLLDGIAVGASVVAGVQHATAWSLLGIGTFLAVFLHKPLDSLSITSVMAVGHWGRRSQTIINVLFSLICPLGALLTYFGVRELGPWQHVAVGCALGFSAGVFLCISLADILPEIQFHRHDRVKLTATLLLGVALALLIGLFEPEHAHHRKPDVDVGHHEHDGHDHEGHDHDKNTEHEH